MSDDRSQPDTTIEQLVAEMLARRAADIPTDPDDSAWTLRTGRPMPLRRHTERPRRRKDGWRWLTAAAGLLLVGGGLFAVVQRDGRDGELDPSTRIETGADDNQDSAGDQRQEGTVDPAPGREVADDPAVVDVVALLPDGLDLLYASMVELGGKPTTDPVQVAEDYLADRLPDLTVAIRPANSDGTLHLFRWSVEDDGFPDFDSPRGWVIARVDPDRAGVVAATTDGVDLAELARTDRRLTATVTHDRDIDLFAEVADLYGQPVIGSVDKESFGTAGSTDGADRLDVRAQIPPWPVTLRLQHVGEAFLSISEVVLDPGGFATSCGLGPPVDIDVGDRLGPIESGPVDDTSMPLIANQAVWHHAGTEASKQTAIEIRWPPDPGLVGRVGYNAINRDLIATIATGTPLSSSTSWMPLTGQNHTLIAVDGNGLTNPCDLVQLSVLGDHETAAWWAGALASEWSFDLPLTVATTDLDPLAGPDGTDTEGSAGASEELIIEIREGADADDVPRVPAVGGCDGLPDDPSRIGAGSGTTFSTADEALAEFVATIGAAESPPLATNGYVEYRPGGDGNRSYVIGSDDRAVAVVEVEQADGGWRVARWEASAC